MPKTKLIHKVKKTPRKKLVIIAVILAIAIGVAVYFGFIYKKPVTNTPSTTQEEDAEVIKQGGSLKNANSQQSNQSDKQGDSSASSSQGVVPPQGNFVSNHIITSSSDSIESVCVTNANATCEITFRQGGTVKTVGKKTTDKNGAATWVWTPASIGLTGGNWDIVAISTYNGKVVEQSDPRQLEVRL